MNAFSSPLESVAFDYFISDVSTIFVSNIWTCLAVFFAGAASFIWRAKSPVKFQLASPEPEGRVASLSPNISVTAPSEPDEVVLSEPGYQIVEQATILESGIGVTKGKFVAYYYPDEENENVCDDEECESGEEHAELMRLFKLDRLERVKEMNEMGLYCSQDSSFLSGDIVRLWDARLM
ncbi:hypothetical protein DCAR_0311594 [Daucus carota subsp. sativus]|uniref:Uncharacterized protein n=1 Tax=Daucus carota subsp. sativus TaxID=79200 RepID=A0A166CRF1_DAUCS|nr:PREDICTED: uncharacterized protein LOC108208336 [Daucus carota subsp. sativus]WOG92330.1 hypothetical protein DCAR_0311594 [Daucus carota subsp. sativus]